MPADSPFYVREAGLEKIMIFSKKIEKIDLIDLIDDLIDEHI